MAWKRFLCGALIFSVAPFAYAQAETFTLDASHTYVLWQVKHLGFSTQAGKWYATGTLSLDKDNPANSKVNVVIDVTQMVTGIPKLDEHLKGAEFFDVAKYPQATFVSDKVTVRSKDVADVQGTLTVHGVAKPVTLHVTLNKAGVSPITNKMTVGFTAYTKIKRSDFGINGYLPALADDVALDIEAEAYQTKSL